MPEVLFILTIIFVAYVVYSVVGDFKKSDDKSSAATQVPVRKPESKPKPKPAAAKPAPVRKQEAKPQAPAAGEKKPEAKPKPAPQPAAAAAVSNEIRNPDTGEVSAVAANYRFVKRWIKEALVKEGLLDKVYKASELNDANTKKIKDALNKIKTLDKYRV